MIKKIKNFAFSSKKRRIITIVVVILVMFSFYKFFSKTSTVTDYVLGEVIEDTIVSSIEGSGQVSSDNELELKPKASGDVVFVNVVPGQVVNRGQLILSLEARDAQKNVRDAEISYNSAKLALDKLKIDQSNSVLDSQREIKDSYHTLLNSKIEAFNVDKNGNSQLQSPTISGDYQLDKEGSITIKPYKSLDGGYSYNVSGLVNCTKVIVIDSPQPICDSGLYITFTTQKNYAESEWLIPIPNTKASNYFSNKSNYDSLILKYKQQIDVDKGSNYFDLKSKEIELTQKYNALQDAKENLSDYSIFAPFDGVVTSLSAKKFTSVSGGSSVGTISTKKKVAIISLNEVDISKIKLNQKVTLSFDAIDGLSISGEVLEVDLLGTVSQGVVNYNVKIGFDTDDERVRPGMSVSANIISEVKQNVLAVPSSAVKSDNNGSYVEVIDNAKDLTSGSEINSTQYTPSKKYIEVGISDDNLVEVLSGLNLGDIIIVRSFSTTNTKTSSGTPSLFGSGNTRGLNSGMRSIQR